jgi:phospholipid/cholesterol/gamma-HCH transport system ATP-binding protein
MGFTLEAHEISQNQGMEVRSTKLFEKVSFKWEAPSLQVVMGPSGSGKSTLLKSIGGVWKPLSGRLLLNNKPLWGRKSFIQDQELLSRIGFAFQNNALFNSLRCLENLTLPHRQRFPEVSEKNRQALAIEWLEKVELGHTPLLYPYELSGGMQKRLSIARALIMKPDFLFLDDPTAGLDPITSKIMAQLVTSLLKGSSALVVIVTNDPDRAKFWGPNIHFLWERALISPGDRRYKEITETYL